MVRVTTRSSSGILRACWTCRTPGRSFALPVTIPRIAAALQHVLGAAADQAARASGFTRRASKLTGARFVQALVFGWLTRPDAGLERLSQTAARLGVAITRHGLDARFTPQAAACLEQVLAAAVQTVLAARPVARALLARFPGGVWVQDSSVIGLPDALGATWPGRGGSAGPTAALKLQVRLDLLTGALAGPLLVPGRAQDRASPRQAGPLPAGAPRLADLGCFSLAERRQRGQAGGHWLTRLPTGTVVFTADGQRWDQLSRLLAAAPAAVDLAVEVGVAERLPARLLAARVPQEVADRRRRRAREDARKQGKAPHPERLARCAWTVLITDLPPRRLTLREALTLARVRWQVELLFKRWKSHHRVDEWQTANPWRIQCAVYAKLVGVIVQHWLLLVGCWHSPDRSLPKAAQTIQEHLAGLTAALRRGAAGRLAAVLEDIAHDLAGGCRLIRRRRRPSTDQLLLALAETEEPDALVPQPRPAALARVA